MIKQEKKHHLLKKKKPTYSRPVPKESQTYTRRLHFYYTSCCAHTVTPFTICTK
ncbi:hypothetical protein EMIT079MI2_160092 [Bacillus sp. IT-79MI2]